MIKYKKLILLFVIMIIIILLLNLLIYIIKETEKEKEKNLIILKNGEIIDFITTYNKYGQPKFYLICNYNGISKKIKVTEDYYYKSLYKY